MCMISRFFAPDDSTFQTVLNWGNYGLAGEALNGRHGHLRVDNAWPSPTSWLTSLVSVQCVSDVMGVVVRSYLHFFLSV